MELDQNGSEFLEELSTMCKIMKIINFMKMMNISFDWFVLNEIGSGNSNFIVPTLHINDKNMIFIEI